MFHRDGPRLRLQGRMGRTAAWFPRTPRPVRLPLGSNPLQSCTQTWAARWETHAHLCMPGPRSRGTGGRRGQRPSSAGAADASLQPQMDAQPFSLLSRFFSRFFLLRAIPLSSCLRF